MLAALSLPAHSAGFTERFQSIDQSEWYVADYDFDHPYFDTDWRPAQASVNQGLRLALTPHAGKNGYIGASLRRHAPSHFGRYEARMRAAKGAGVVTGFFTYTGPHYGTRHDEIDIEFLGRDTTKLHAAWFVDGELTNHFIPLGFDAAEEAHDYAFEWAPDRLNWYVDGKLVFTHHAADGAIPQVPGMLFANIWAADPVIAAWSGETLPGTEAEALVEYIRFIPAAAAGGS
ncbi:family 16 glycosylhydrolase [Alphaproteobacteria bacterium KMM 3653]|uniref:Beta-glucanase n=1 Tax=Harenicola maris TaxID=2841044 RepID=A0AAP2CR62_9RHOB|nr:family 16 glycosylhydrolase [Harenicola maris]